MVKLGIFGGSRIEHENVLNELKYIGKSIIDVEVIITGASPGYPYEVVKESYKQPRKTLIIGISPFSNEEEHIERGLITDSHDYIFYTGLGTHLSGNEAYQARNHINTALSEKVLILPGREGTLNELELCIQQRKPFVLFSEVDKEWDRKTEEIIERYDFRQYSRGTNSKEIIDLIFMLNNGGKNE